MNNLRHREDEEHERASGSDREVTLGTTLILGIFFALAVLCAVFFGFGYSLGRKSSPPLATASNEPALTNFGSFKPAAGLTGPAAPVRPAAGGSAVTVPFTPPATSVKPLESTTPVHPDVDSQIVTEKTLQRPADVTASAAPPAALASIVQVAAVSHQEDADLLVTELKRRGYNVAIHQEPQDKLLHVQVGPFPTHKEAEAMRQKLLSDGYNAIVKEAR